MKSLVLLTVLVSCSTPNESSWSGSVISSSRLDARILHANRDQLAKIAMGPIVSGTTPEGWWSANPVVHSMLEDPGARSLLSLVLACALPSNMIMTAKFDGDEFLFVGQTGLAIEWMATSLTGPARGWVSACVLARLDESGLATPISMRGDHPSLQADNIERQLFPVEEGAFFGDVFSGSMAACSGPPESRDRAERVCARQADVPTLTMCGFSYAGSCADACDPQGDLNVRCRLDGAEFHEVVTTFLID